MAAFTSSATAFAVIPNALKAVRITFLRDGSIRSNVAIDWASVDLEAVRFFSSDYVMRAASDGALTIGRLGIVSAALLVAYAAEGRTAGRLNNATLDELAAHSAFGKTFSADKARKAHAALESMAEVA